MKKYILLIFITGFLASCSDSLLDRTPVDELVPETAFENLDDLDAAVNGIFSGAGLNYTEIIRFNSIISDNVTLGGNNGGQELNLLNQIVDTQTNSLGIWSNHYQIANRCNRALQAAELVDFDENNIQELRRYNQAVATAFALRAYAHYELLNYYGEDNLNPASLGVPYQDEVSTDATPSRLTTGETIERILDDLATAEMLLDGIVNTNPINVSQDFVTFMRARVGLMTGDWPAVIDNTNDIIDSYQLANPAQYLSMFTTDSDVTEVIFKYENQLGANRNYANIWIFTGTGGNFISLANGLFDELAARGDVRFQVNVNPESDPGDFGINKYPGIGGQFLGDFKAMRASEAYLMRAEAHIRGNGDLAAAAADVKAVRDARAGTDTGVLEFSSVNDGIRGVRDERRLELAFEGHRFIDLKRYRNILNQGLERDPRDCDGNIPCEISVNDRRWTLPIPIAETNGNPNIQQNPGW